MRCTQACAPVMALYGLYVTGALALNRRYSCRVLNVFFDGLEYEPIEAFCKVRRFSRWHFALGCMPTMMTHQPGNAGMLGVPGLHPVHGHWQERLHCTEGACLSSSPMCAPAAFLQIIPHARSCWHCSAAADRAERGRLHNGVLVIVCARGSLAPGLYEVCMHARRCAKRW